MVRPFRLKKIKKNHEMHFMGNFKTTRYHVFTFVRFNKLICMMPHCKRKRPQRGVITKKIYTEIKSSDENSNLVGIHLKSLNVWMNKNIIWTKLII